MGAHLINGEFQSDKYPDCPRGKVPLSCADVSAQDLLWEYAQRRRPIDAEFSEDLEEALHLQGYKEQPGDWDHPEVPGTKALVMYFKTEKDREAFVSLIREVRPTFQTRNL